MPDHLIKIIERYGLTFNPVARYIDRMRGDISRIEDSRTWKAFNLRSMAIAASFLSYLNRHYKRKRRSVGIAGAHIERQKRIEFLNTFRDTQKEKIRQLADYRKVDIKIATAEVSKSGLARIEKVRLLKGLRTYGKQAEFVSRESMSQFISQVNNITLSEQGKGWFKWVTRRDDKVRESHKAHHNRIYHLDTPPFVGSRHLLPGQDYNCRCWSESV